MGCLSKEKVKGPAATQDEKSNISTKGTALNWALIFVVAGLFRQEDTGIGLRRLAGFC